LKFKLNKKDEQPAGSRLEGPRRITLLQTDKFKSVMRFIFRPTLVRIDNESDLGIYVADHEIKKGTITVDDRKHAMFIGAHMSAVPPMLFKDNELWAYSPDGDAVIKITYTDSVDLSFISKLTTGVGGAVSSVERIVNAQGDNMYSAPVYVSGTTSYTTITDGQDVDGQHAVMVQPVCAGVSSNASGLVEFIVARSVDGVNYDNGNLSNCLSVSVYLNGTSEVSALQEINTKGVQKLAIAAVVNKAAVDITGAQVRVGLPWGESS
jgi:hypothetical protein